MRVRGRVEGAAELRKKLRALPDQLQQPIKEAILTGATELQTALRAAAPGRGNLRAKIAVRIRRKGLEALVGFGRGKRNLAHIARFNEFGTAAHIIAAKKKKAVTAGDGVFRRVQHPGQPARPFIVPTFKRLLPAIKARIAERTKIALKSAGQIK